MPHVGSIIGQPPKGMGGSTLPVRGRECRTCAEHHAVQAAIEQGRRILAVLAFDVIKTEKVGSPQRNKLSWLLFHIVFTSDGRAISMVTRCN